MACPSRLLIGIAGVVWLVRLRMTLQVHCPEEEHPHSEHPARNSFQHSGIRAPLKSDCAMERRGLQGWVTFWVPK